MVKQILIATLLLSASLTVKAQEGTPRPSFFEEERRLTTPTNSEINSDRQVRQTKGFTETFLTDALNGVGDPGAATESRTGLNSTLVTPSKSDAPPVPLGIFTRPPASGIFTNPPRSN